MKIETIMIIVSIVVVALVLIGLVLFLVISRKKAKAEDAKPVSRRKPVQQTQTSTAPLPPKPTKARKEPEAPKPVEQQKPAPQAAVAPAFVPQVNEDSDENDDEYTQVKAVVENGETRYIVIKYSKSFTAKVIQSSEETKRYYSEIKNTLLSYKGVKSRMSWKWETFRAGRKALAKLRLRGKTLSLVLALNPDGYADTKYVVESLADVKAYAETPCLYRIKNDRRLKYSADLIAAVMKENGLEANAKAEAVDYAVQYPYETTEALIQRSLIKELTDEEAQSGTAFKPSDIRKSVTAQEVNTLMRDDVAASLVQVQTNGGVSDKTRTSIINIDTLSQTFKDGERVTLEEIKKRVAGFDRKTTYLKILARGTLDKKLTVEADNFSLQAVKMIVLTGGTAVRK